MSEWRTVDKDDISFSEDRESVHVFLEQNDFGSVYLEIPLNHLVEVLGDFLRAAKDQA